MKHVIIGASAAGISCIEGIRKKDKESSITIIQDERLPLYSRCLLTYLLAGSIQEEGLQFRNKDFYNAFKVDAIHGVKADSIDLKKKSVKLNNNKTISFDKLLIATGAMPKKIDAPGVDKKGVFTVRNIEDARGILKLLDKVERVAILGGGLIGLRDAYALNQRGKETYVIVKSPTVLSQMVDREAAEIISAVLKSHGIKILTGLSAKEIIGDNAVKGVLLDNGETLACELVIIGKGVSPTIDLAKACGIKVHYGIIVNEYLMTSQKDIYAAGDAAEAFDIVLGSPNLNALWPCAIEQGRVAGLNMAGEKTRYIGSLSMNSIDFFGIPAISMGVTKPEEEGFEILTKKTENCYKKIVIKENRIVGMVFAGDIKNAGVINILIKKEVDVSIVKEKLLDENFDYAKILPLVKNYKDKFVEEEFKDTVITYK